MLHRYYGDMVIATLQDHAYEAISMAGEHEELHPMFMKLREDPPPMLKDNYELDSECLTGERLRAAVLPGQSEVRPALFQSVCAMDVAVCPGLVVPNAGTLSWSY